MNAQHGVVNLDQVNPTHTISDLARDADRFR